jgi:hypothetical protein
MHRFNRILVIVELVLAIAVMPALIAILLFFRGALVATTEGMARTLLDEPGALYTQTVCIGLAAFLFLAAILLLVLELNRPALHGLRVQQVKEGQVDITADAITSRLEHDVLQVADVTRVHPHVVATRKGLVDLFLELETTPEVNVPQKTQEVIAVARRVMEEQLGLELGKVQVQVDHLRKPKKAAEGETRPPEVADGRDAGPES